MPRRGKEGRDAVSRRLTEGLRSKQLRICTHPRRPREIYQISVGAGFYPARAGKTGGFAFVSAHSYHVAGDLCIRDCAPPGGVEPLPYATGENFTDSHWYVLIYNAPLHNPFVTASPCHLPLHKGGFGWCKRGGAVKTCDNGRGKPLPHVTTKRGGIFTLCPKCARMAAVWGRLYDRASGGGCF